MSGAAAKVSLSDYVSNAEYIEKLIDQRAGIELADGKIASSVVDELTGFFSGDYDDCDTEKDKALREKYGLAY